MNCPKSIGLSDDSIRRNEGVLAILDFALPESKKRRFVTNSNTIKRGNDCSLI